MLRILGGELRGRAVPVRVPGTTRPTTALVREAIVSMLDARGLLAGVRLLELFGGTGAVGFEALSRGAAHVTWVDENSHLAAEVRRAARLLGLADRFDAYAMRAERFLAGPGAAAVVDVCVLDPPYVREDLEPLGATLPACRLVVVEARREVRLGPRWHPQRWRRYGSTQVGLFEPVT